MGLFTRDIQSMEDMFEHGLKDVYYAEQQIVESLPKLIDKAASEQLKEGLENHLSETRGQVDRLEQVFEKIGIQLGTADCPAIDGLIKEADSVVGEVGDEDVMDAAIVGAAQAVEHYEIARYGTLIAWAEELGHKAVVPLLTTNLKEEKAADEKLNELALQKGLNREAAS